MHLHRRTAGADRQYGLEDAQGGTEYGFLGRPVSIGTEQAVIDALWLKQQVTSHNIANVETPGYKAKQVEFSEILKKTDDGGEPVKEYRTVVSEDDSHMRRTGREQCPA